MRSPHVAFLALAMSYSGGGNRRATPISSSRVIILSCQLMLDFLPKFSESSRGSRQTSTPATTTDPRHRTWFRGFVFLRLRDGEERATSASRLRDQPQQRSCASPAPDRRPGGCRTAHERERREEPSHVLPLLVCERLVPARKAPMFYADLVRVNRHRSWSAGGLHPRDHPARKRLRHPPLLLHPDREHQLLQPLPFAQ